MIIKISNTLFIDQSLVDSIYRSRGKTMIDLSNGSTFSSSKTVEEIAKLVGGADTSKAKKITYNEQHLKKGKDNRDDKTTV